MSMMVTIAILGQREERSTVPVRDIICKRDLMCLHES